MESGNYLGFFSALRSYHSLEKPIEKITTVNESKSQNIIILSQTLISQNHLNKQFKNYLNRRLNDLLKNTDNVHPIVLTRSIQQLVSVLEELEGGHCEGYASKWIYGKMLAEKGPAKKEVVRDDTHQFFATLYNVATFNMESLSEQDYIEIEYFLSTLVYFQNPGYYTNYHQGELQFIAEESKSDRHKSLSKSAMTQEYQLNGTFTQSQLAKLLDKICKPGRGILVHSHDHATAIFQETKSTKITYFDSNNKHGEEKLINTEVLAEHIFKANNFDPDKPSLIGLRIFAHRDASPEKYPKEEELLKKIKAENYLEDTYAGGINALHQSVREGDILALKYYLEKDNAAEALTQTAGTKEYGQATPLIAATSVRNSRALEVLLDDGRSNVKALDSKGRSLLHTACFFGRNESIDLLLDRKEVNPNKAIKGEFCHKLYTIGGNVEFELEGATPLHFAVLSNRIDTVKKMLERKEVDHECVTANRYGVLHVAARLGDPDMMQFLLSTNKFDLQQKDNLGFTFLERIVGYEDVGLLHVIWKHEGIKKDIFNNKILQLAIEHERPLVINWLAANKVFDFTKKMSNGLYPLEYAVKLGKENVIHELLKIKELDINATDKNGHTLLMRMLLGGDSETALMLLKEQGIETNKKNILGKTSIETFFMSVPRFKREYKTFEVDTLFEKLLEKEEGILDGILMQIHYCFIVTISYDSYYNKECCFEALSSHPRFNPNEIVKKDTPAWLFALQTDNVKLFKNIIENPRFRFEMKVSDLHSKDPYYLKMSLYYGFKPSAEEQKDIIFNNEDPFILGLLHEQKGDEAKAMSYYNKVAKTSNDYIYCQSKIANYFTKKSEFDKALSYYKKALSNFLMSYLTSYVLIIKDLIRYNFY